ITLLFDEVHDDDNWSKTLKILYDEARTAFILCTGSSALMLNSTADLSRRMYIQQVFPFNLTELLHTQNELSPDKNLILPQATLSMDLREALFYIEDKTQVLDKLKILQTDADAVINQKNINFHELQERYIAFL